MYTKVFHSMLDSTIWCESNETRIVWITMLAMKDKHHEVRASIPGLANRARVTIEQVETALSVFLAPDPYSRTADHEGRRIEVIDGGWFLLNGEKHEKIRRIEDRRTQNRESQARFRKRVGKQKCLPNADGKRQSSMSAHTDTDTDTDTKKESSSGLAPDAAGFSGVVIKLTSQDYQRWRESFTRLDLDSELVSRDAWLAEQPEPTRKRWFISTSQHLANRNRDARLQQQEPVTDTLANNSDLLAPVT